jgi:hypothetical protein
MLSIGETMSASFAVLSLPEKLKERMLEVGVWKSDCPIGMDRLRLVKFIHYDFSHEQQQGEMVVLEVVAARVLEIFRVLFQYQFPIAQARTIEQYEGLDKPSMAANNSSAFNYRPIAGKTMLSIHSYGLAIDINPIQNPCLVQQPIVNDEEVFISVQPAAGQAYLNRIKVRPGMAEQVLNEATKMRVVELFQQHGFHVWGGNWNDPVDWQHFQPSRATAEWLAFMSPEDANALFELYIEKPHLLNNLEMRNFDFKSLYEKDPFTFMQTIRDPIFWNKSPKEAYESLSI